MRQTMQWLVIRDLKPVPADSPPTLQIFRCRTHRSCMASADSSGRAMFYGSNVSSNCWNIHKKSEFLSWSLLIFSHLFFARDTIISTKSSPNSVESIVLVSSCQNASAAWFLISAECWTLNSSYNKRGRQLEKFLEMYTEFMIHINTSWSMRTVNLWSPSMGIIIELAKPQPNTPGFLYRSAALPGSAFLTKSWVWFSSNLFVFASGLSLFAFQKHSY